MKNWRPNLVILFFVLFSAAAIGRLIYIQILNYPYWRALAQGQQNIYADFSGERGKIFFSGNSSAVATNRDSAYVFLSPGEISGSDSEKTADFLAKELNLGKDFVSGKMRLKDNLFVVLKDDLTDAEIESVKNYNSPGVYLGTERQRYYPYGELASHLLGFVDASNQGQYGMEGYYQETLRGGESSIKGEKGPLGFLFLSSKDDTLQNGADITLTIDYNIQFMAEKLLERAKDGLGIESGQIIVVKPDTGEIIALADFPNFDPNLYSEYAKADNLEIFQNSATQKIFEPGSAFKPITMAVGLERGVVTPQTTYIDEGFVKFGGSTIYNYDGRKYGQETMTQVLEKSINTGAVFVERLIPHNVFLDYLEKFGFFEKTGVDLPEVFSDNKELKKGYEINFATASFGQGIEMTPMQLVRAFSAIANGGRLVTPYLVDKKNENGKLIKKQIPEVSDPIISQKTISQLTAMLVSVVENGYSKSASIPGYYIAGKTGTAQVPEAGGYSLQKTIQSFIGFAPAFNPQFVILVKLDNPNTKTAEYSAVPIFHDLAKYIINLWQIAPDYQSK